jgi:hypothetical protein
LNQLKENLDIQKKDFQILKDNNQSNISDLEKTKIDLNFKNSELIRLNENNVSKNINSRISIRQKSLKISILLRLN